MDSVETPKTCEKQNKKKPTKIKLVISIMNHEKDKYHLYAKTNTANYIYHTRLKEHSNFQKKTNTNETLTKSHWRYFKTTYLFDWTI